MAMPFCGSSNVQTLSSCAISNHLRTKENENSKAPMGNHKTCIIIAHLICLQIATARASLPLRHHHNWLSHGGDIRNRRYAVGETRITSLTASKLRPKWEFNTGKDVTATPAIFDGIVYFPSWNGFIYAVKAADGSLVWKKNLKALTGLAPSLPLENVTSTVSRATPTVAQNKLIVPIYGPAYVVALNRTTGELVWMRQLDRHPAAVVTMSGTFYKRALYIGVSSLEETAAIEDCCTFRGSFLKLDISTGMILWRTYMIPDNHGKTSAYAGAAIWGSSPSIDAQRRHVYIATGNLYSVPESVEECQKRQNNQTVPTYPDECVDPDVHFNSILAMDLGSGEIKWYRQLGGYDVWFFACENLSTPNCPPGPNPDADFGEAPMMLNFVGIGGTRRDIAVAVQKSGFAWALDRDNGGIVWSTEAGPGSGVGGGSWGAATDAKRVYTAINNGNRKNFTLRPGKIVTTSGAWVAMDGRTGRVLWSTAIPDNAVSNPVTVANGVLFAGSTYRTGPIYAIDVKTGEILWRQETGASVYGGLSVSNGCVYVGNGYAVHFGVGNSALTAGTSLFAFCVE